MYIPYVSDENLKGLDSTELEIVDRIRKRRAPAPLQPLDRALLHSPPVADGWNSFLGSIRTKTTIDAALRELVICRIAVCNDAWYEWEDHAPLALRADVTVAALELIRKKDLANVSKAELKQADMMTYSLKLQDGMFEKLRAYFGEREIVEIIATISCYNCVSRFLVALNVGEKNETVTALD
ncbi:AhpD-like protein [Fusarium tricinctum]|uniref:AhpD-like protein n=1 Tax=Fusarium tricinctum TaxID=61284 RepID=A0A8K0W9B4_9HYPO|nr:AhpD-like protein [Fusarium tricinctum]